ncbi:alpha-amylase family glycosyl hydrolase [Candidatus Viridilinea mediisalina]|uniref:Alpha-amylase n=1 Tax=Candidatus Viridilinea mediisalina TaxID=2024553 RepID=A0A2A6RHJ2_9CHLR|nr:alpha-amylase [Candidatus Viridilinea mediisalina]
MTNHIPWWQSGTIYQIYPRSFQDSNGDGVGDLPGIIQRLPYLQWLGVDALWLSPIYPSPMADFGYDVADYTNVDPLFGSLDDLDQLVRETHARGMRLILDLVPNHTSDEHPWFVQARATRENPYRDWYIWRDPAPDGGPPNNWLSHFGGPAWTLDPATGQYYLHLFDPKQPDLNWRNPEVRQAIYEVMRFWFARGVDGFRIDVIWMLIKHPELPDNPLDPDWTPAAKPQNRLQRIYDQHQPEVHEIIREMRCVADEFPERVLIGEIYLPIEQLVSYYGSKLDEVHLPYNFNLLKLKDWHASAVRDLVEHYERALPAGAWPNWVLGNHDQPRLATRVGQAAARLGQMLLLTLRGTPTIYYGDELGMENVPIPAEQIVDPQGIRAPGWGRDPERTPMQWDDSLGAGFTTGIPWLPLAADYARRNVALQREGNRSLLTLTRRLLELRRSHAALSVGRYSTCPTANQDVFAYLRSDGTTQLLVLLNFDSQPVSLDMSSHGAEGDILVSSLMDREGSLDLASLNLRPHEGLVVALR